MSKLAKAVKANDNVTTTENGAKAFKSTLNDVLDFFYKAGASRGKNLVGSFLAAFKEDADRAIRVALWTRDVRAVLVSGFSPALMKSIVSGEDVTPLGMMDKIILDERYTV